MFVLNTISKKSKEWWNKSTSLVEDGMGGEGDLEAGVVGQEMQISAKDGMGGERDLEAKMVG
jgi:hypothetical protein